jgi:hypothetical protein
MSKRVRLQSKSFLAVGSFFVVIICLILLAAGAVQADTSEVGVRLIGRFDRSTPGVARFGWPGSAIQFDFSGTELQVKIGDSGKNSLVVDVDGAISRLDLREGIHSYWLAKGLPPGRHQVKMIRRTEGFLGVSSYEGASVDGQFLGNEAPRRQMLVIGDSISAGLSKDGTWIAGSLPTRRTNI